MSEIILEEIEIAIKDPKYLVHQNHTKLVSVANEIIEGKFHDQFPLSVWQTGSGTQTNMNVNEVIAYRANQLMGKEKLEDRIIHPNDHCNMSQSSNDSFPSVIHIAITLLAEKKLTPSIQKFITSLKEKEKEFSEIIKIGRTHFQDATPLTQGQELSSFRTQFENALNRIKLSLDEILFIAQGGTAVGTGLNSSKEFIDGFLKALNKITTEISKPITCIIGGSKISTKINIIKNLITKFDNIVIVGAMANNFIEYFGNNIGKSIKENKSKPIVEEILFLSQNENCNLIFPEDVIVAKNFNDLPVVKKLKNISSEDMILDIGPNTIKNIYKVIDDSNTILWNGPAGYFENPNFANGSIEIAKKIIEKNVANKIYSVVGGGDTVSLINSLDAVNNFNFVSTAGGAFLEYLEGKKLPGITALNSHD